MNWFLYSHFWYSRCRCSFYCIWRGGFFGGLGIVERAIISDVYASICGASLLFFQRVCVYFILAVAHQRWDGRGDCPEKIQPGVQWVYNFAAIINPAEANLQLSFRMPSLLYTSVICETLFPEERVLASALSECNGYSWVLMVYI